MLVVSNRNKSLIVTTFRLISPPEKNIVGVLDRVGCVIITTGIRQNNIVTATNTTAATATGTVRIVTVLDTIGHTDQ